MGNNTDERALFEAWMREQNQFAIFRRLLDDSRYESFETEWAWRGFVQGRATLASQPSAGEMPSIDTLTRYAVQDDDGGAYMVPSESGEYVRLEDARQSQPVSRGAVLIGLLREARATLEMWKDVAPAVSLCADIDKALASQPVAAQAHPADQTEVLAGAVWNQPNTASQVHPSMARPHIPTQHEPKE